MTTPRSEAIALAVTTLEALTFAKVFTDIPDKVDGQSPVAIVYGQSYRFDMIARGMFETPSEIACLIAVRRFPGEGAAAGAAIDGLVLAAMTALFAAGFRDISSSAGAGVPQWIPDGTPYRIERITMRMND